MALLVLLAVRVTYTRALCMRYSAREEILKFFKKRRWYMEIKSYFLDEIAKELNFTQGEVEILSSYPEGLLNKAYSRTALKSDLNNKFRYFEAICKREADSFFKKEAEKKAKKEKAANAAIKKPWAPCSINAWQHKSYQDNIDRWMKYENSEAVQDYIKHFGSAYIKKQYTIFLRSLNLMTLAEYDLPVQEEGFFRQQTAAQIVEEIKKIQELSKLPAIYGGAQYGNRIIFNLVQKDYIPEEGDSTALEFIDDMRIEVGLESRNPFKMPQNSTTLNDNAEGRLNTQEKENHSSTIKFEQVENIENLTVPERLNKFEGHPQFDVIKQFYYQAYGVNETVDEPFYADQIEQVDMHIVL
jgi:hypothetical protein